MKSTHVASRMACSAQWLSEIDKFVVIKEKQVRKFLEDVLNKEISLFRSYDDIYDCVGQFIISWYPREVDNEAVKNLCNNLLSTIEIKEDNNIQDEAETLVNPISFDDDAIKSSDSNKLNKSSKYYKDEARQKEKMRKKNITAPNIEAKSTIDLTTNQMISKKSLVDSEFNKILDLKFESIDLYFGSRVLLKGASSTFHYGKKYGIIGRNGYGKTTFFRAISRRELLYPSHISVVHVEQEVPSSDLSAIQTVISSDSMIESLKNEEKTILDAMNQDNDPDRNTFLTNRLQMIYDKLNFLDEDKAVTRASTILSGLGFSQEAQRMPTKDFSGGWRMRIALAKALFAAPDVLLLDEPTNMLDLKVVIWLQRFLENWPSTLLLISHDKCFLNSVVTDVIHLNNHQLEHYSGDYDTFIRIKEDKMTNHQRLYDAQMLQRKHIQAFVDRFRANANRASQAQSKIKVLEKMPDLKPVEEEPDIVFKFPSSEKMHGYLLKLDNVSFGYSSEKTILKNLSLNCSYDSRVTVVGENGSGKTTLLRLLLGELEPSSGLRSTNRNLKVGYFCQHHVDALEMTMNSIQILASKYPGKTELEYRSQLGQFGLSADLATRPISTLSGGQKSRAVFASIAMGRPNFLILDEPTNHLDIETVEALCKALGQFIGGIILVSHNEQLIKSITKELWICRSGKIVNSKISFDEYKKALVEQCNQSFKLSTM